MFVNIEGEFVLIEEVWVLEGKIFVNFIGIVIFVFEFSVFFRGFVRYWLIFIWNGVCLFDFCVFILDVEYYWFYGYLDVFLDGNVL